MLFNSRIYLFAFLSVICVSQVVNGQIQERRDSTLMVDDSIKSDRQTIKDSTHLKKAGDDGFKSDVDYSAKDSMRFSSDNKKVYLYGKAKVNYEDIELKSDYMEFDFTTQIVYAAGLPDSAGVMAGKPEFTQKKEKFNAETITYNFKTKKGIIRNVITKQDDGILHAEKTKRLNNGQIDLLHGKYTTCDAPNPHFYLALNQGIVIPSDKIVFRSAHLVIADIPLPIWLPFGFFPNKRQSTSGIIIPSYGSDYTRGFSLRDAGYYFAINQHIDLRLTGNIYSNGSWGINGTTRYIKRYKFSGNALIQYAINNFGEAGVDQSKSKLYSVTWNHSQDSKANPSQTFGANVAYSSSSFDKSENYADPIASVQSQKSSSINFSKTWTNFNVSTGVTASQNVSLKRVDLTLPTISFSANRIYPFRKKESIGEMKWYENITINYKADLTNQMTGGDSTIFTSTALKNSKNGFHHTLPLSVNFKLLKFFNITPTLNYEGMLYTYYNVRVNNDTVSGINQSHIHRYKELTVHQMTYAQGFSPSLGISFIQPWYGRIDFPKKSKVQAIRHVITPSIGFNFVPPLGSIVPTGYFRKYYTNDFTKVNEKQNVVDYSIYDSNVYGSPHVSKRSGGLTFGLTNNLEMKVKSDKDTITGIRKIVLIQTFNFNSSYNLFADSFKLSTISFNGTIPVFKGFDFTFNGSLDPYQTRFSQADSTGKKSLIRFDKYIWQDHLSLGRLTNFSFSVAYHLQSAAAKGAKTTEPAQPQTPPLNGATKLPDAKDQSKSNTDIPPPMDYNYFKIPWSLSVNYSFNYTKTLRSNDSLYRTAFVQVLGFSGNLSLTPKWKINFNSGYDFRANKFNHTIFGIQRDLHCWAMSVDFCPFGTGRFYSFRLNVLSALLRDLKYEKKQDYYDYGNGYGGY